MIIVIAALVAFLFWADPALADPISGSAIFAFFQSSFVARLALRIVLAVALNKAQQAKARRAQERARKAGSKIPYTTSGGTEPQTTTLGRSATAGHLAYSNSYGKNNHMMVQVIELSDLPGVGLSRLIVDGEYAELSAPPTHGTEVSLLNRQRKGEDYCFLTFYDGSQTTADPTLVAQFGEDEERPWSENHLLTGVAYVVLRMRGSQKVWQSGRPNFRFELTGARLYDPRLDSTVGGVGPQRWDAPETWATTQNPIVIIYNILRGISLPDGETWGGSTEASDLPLPNWIAAMNACDETITLLGGGTRARYTGGLEFAFDQEPAEIISELLEACNGDIAEFGGVWTVHVGTPDVPVVAIHDDDLIATESHSFDPFPPSKEIYNSAKISFTSPEAFWNGREADEIINLDWEAEDGGRNELDLQLPSVFVSAQAAQLGNEMLKDNRRLRRHQIPLPPEFSWLKPLNTLSWTSPWNYYDAKLFEIAEVSLDPRTLITVLSVRERDSADFDPDAAYELPEAPLPYLPVARITGDVPGFTAAPYSLQDGDGTNRRPGILMTWNGSEIDQVSPALEFEIQVQATAQAAWSGRTTDVESGRLVVAPLLPAVLYRARARAHSEVSDTLWTPWQDVLTPDLRLSALDLGTALNARVDEAFERHDAVVAEATGSIAELRDLLFSDFSEFYDFGESLTTRIENALGPLNPTVSLSDQIEASFGPLSTVGPSLTDRIEASLGPLDLDVSLSDQIDIERARLDVQIPLLGDARGAVDDLWSRMIALQGLQFATDQRISDAGIVVDPDTGQVRITGFESTTARVADVEFSLDAALGEINQRATVAYVNTAISNAVLDPSQIPIVDDLTLRISTVETTLSAETGRIDQLSDTLSVNGGLVTMTSVTQQLDSLNSELELRVSQAEFGPQVARLDAAEITLADLGDTSAIKASVAASRQVTSDQAENTEEDIAERWARFEGDQVTREATALGQRELRATVDEFMNTEASERLALRSEVDGSVAQLEQTLETQATTNLALAQSIDHLQADLTGVEQGVEGQSLALSETTAQVAEMAGDLASEATSRQVLAARVSKGETDADDQTENAILAVWNSWSADQAARDEMAVNFSQASARVEEGLQAEATERKVLGAALDKAKASLVSETQIRATETSALAERTTQLEASLGTAGTAQSGTAEAVEQVSARVDTVDGEIIALGARTTSLETAVTDQENELAGTAAAVDQVDARVDTVDGEITALGQRATSLESAVDDLDTELAGTAQAVTDVTTRVDTTEAGLISQAEARDLLAARVSKGETDAEDQSENAILAAWNSWSADQAARDEMAVNFSEASARVEEGLQAEATERKVLGAALDKAKASLVSETQIRATETGALAERTTQLEASFDDVQTAQSGTATAVDQVATRVDQTEVGLTALGARATSLETAVTDQENELAGTAAAVDQVDARVDTVDGEITALGQRATSLEASVNDQANELAGTAQAVDQVDARVDTVDGEITALGQRATSLEASVDDQANGIAGNASAVSTVNARVDSTNAQVTSVAGRTTTLEASSADATSRISAIEGAYVDAAGAVTAVEQEISAEFGTLAAMATDTAFAKAGVEGISAGYLWRLNGQNVLELVSVDGGTEGAQVTAKIDADYVQITGLAQIDQAVLGTIAADNAFLGNLTVNTLQIGPNAVTVPISAQQGVPAVITSTTNWVPVLALAINRAGYETRVSFSGQVSAQGGSRGNYVQEAAILRTRLVRNGVVIAGPLAQTTAAYGHQVSISWNVTDRDLGTGPTVYQIQASKLNLGTHYLNPKLQAADLFVQQFKR